MSVSIKQDYKCFPTQEEIVLKRQQNAVLADIAAIHTAMGALTTKMDADGGITDTNYGTVTAALLTNELVA